MSEETDCDYRPNKQQLCKVKTERKERPVRKTRSVKEYKEVVLVTKSDEVSSEEEQSGDSVQGEVVEDSRLKNRIPEVQPLPVGRQSPINIEGFSLTDFSTRSITNEPCLSPNTVARTTENIRDQLSVLQTHIS